MPHIHAHFAEGDAEVIAALEKHKELICQVIARTIDEPQETIAFLPMVRPAWTGKITHNADRLELEVYDGSSRLATHDEVKGNEKVANAQRTILSVCPLLKAFQWGLWIRTSIMWGYASYDPKKLH